MSLPHDAYTHSRVQKIGLDTYMILNFDGLPYAIVHNKVLWLAGEGGQQRSFSCIAFYIPALRAGEAVGSIWVVVVDVETDEKYYMSIASAWKSGTQRGDYLFVEGTAVAGRPSCSWTNGDNR